MRNAYDDDIFDPENEPTKPDVSRVGHRVEVEIPIEDPRAGSTHRPAFGRVVGLDMVGVLLEGETIPRAFERRNVRKLP